MIRKLYSEYLAPMNNWDIHKYFALEDYFNKKLSGLLDKFKPLTRLVNKKFNFNKPLHNRRCLKKPNIMFHEAHSQHIQY